MGNYHSRIAEIFTTLDQDQNGYLTKEDIKEWFCDERFLGSTLFSPRHNGVMNMDELTEKFFEFVDTNGDDLISFDELATYFAERDVKEIEGIASTLKDGNDHVRLDVLRRVFHELDTKKDGIIPKSIIEDFFMNAQFVSKDSLADTFELLQMQGSLLKFPDFAQLFHSWKLREIRLHTEDLLEQSQRNHREEVLARHKDIVPPDVQIEERNIASVLQSIIHSAMQSQSPVRRKSSSPAFPSSSPNSIRFSDDNSVEPKL